MMYVNFFKLESSRVIL